MLRWGLDPRDPTDQSSDPLPFPHLQDTINGYLVPKSTFSPSCYCPWLGLKSFRRKKWTVSDLRGLPRAVWLEGRLLGEMGKCAGPESLQQPLGWGLGGRYRHTRGSARQSRVWVFSPGTNRLPPSLLELPVDLQYLSPDKQREPDADIRKMLIEAIMLVSRGLGC